MEREATEEMLRYTAEVCGKYREIKMLAEEAEAAWKQSLALMAESKYPSEKEMYEREAAEELEKYESARSWMKLVNATVSKVKEEKARLVLKQNCLEGATMKAVLVDKKAEIYMSRSTATRYKKKGLVELSCRLVPLQSRLEEMEKNIYKNEPV